MIKAIIFDCFGVLVGEGWKPFRDEYFGTMGEKHDWAEEQMQRVSRGQISHEEFAKLMHEETGVQPEDFIEVLHDNPSNVALLEYIEDLTPKYKIGFLSNVGKNRLAELFTEHQLGLFDEMTLSYEIGISKPNPEAYKYTAQKLGVMPAECIFVDDTVSYCKGAEATGMKTIVYTDFRSFKQQLETML